MQYILSTYGTEIFLTKIDLVDQRTMMYIPSADFIELSMVKSHNKTYLRCFNPKIDVAKALENIKNKILTPNEKKVLTLEDLYKTCSFRHPLYCSMGKLLTCISHWQRGFKKKNQGFKFIPNYQGV
jgi:hypothetical protein